MTIEEAARTYDIDAYQLLHQFKKNLLLEKEYFIYNTFNDLRLEMRFSPALIKTAAENLKKQSNPQQEAFSTFQNIQDMNTNTDSNDTNSPESQEKVATTISVQK